MTLTARDIDILSRTAAGEARGETFQAQLAVCWVAVNRSAIAKAYLAAHGHPHSLYGDGSIAAACLARLQFSCWNASDPNRPKILAMTLDDPDLQRATAAALQAALGLTPDPTQGATGYWDISIAPPAWAEGLSELSIGRLKFVKMP